MMKKLLPFILMAFLAFMGSCVADDIDDLQGQIDDLNEKVDDLEQSQQEALLAEIAKLQATITQMQTDMEAGDADLNDKYTSLLSSLELLETEVENNNAAVYYGNLLTDADFAAVLAQGATIVTGKVIPTTQGHIDAMVNLKMIGGDLIIKGGNQLSLTSVQAVGGELGITGVDGTDVTITFPSLTSVGDDFSVYENEGLTSVTADALILINGGLSVYMNTVLQSFSLTALDQVETVDINGYDESLWGAGTLNSVELSSTNVSGDVYVQYIAGGTLSLGNVNGSLSIENTAITEFIITGSLIDGDFNFTSNSAIASVDVTALTKVNGGLNFSFNGTGGTGISSTSTSDFSTNFPSFENLEEINGDVVISTNTTKSIEAFNSVTTFTGGKIDIQSNGFEVAMLNIFNGLESGGTSAYSHVNVSVFGSYAWFDSFEMLQNAGAVILNVSPTMDLSTYQYADNLRIDGFDALTQATSIELYTPKATVFSAFSALDHLTGWGTDLKVEMPDDATIGFCSMEPFFTKYNSDPTKYVVEFNQGWGNTLVPEDAIDLLLAPCNN
ncbi:coiled-coil domain-containing protein [Labilibacter marinus]|uniref:coiled-coil domain-containing protein n=1 Tax=Labilibacter marinus TaxID=1477105 RepID=UPI001179F908|nr:FlxA-like family protein [Labilibacter marinus]